MSRICLNMIVRDESANIARCLRSVKAHIDAWSIVDTGSVDDTMPQVLAELEGLPGKLDRHPWHDFAYNRTQALEFAKRDLTLANGDFLLFLDADDWLEFPPDFRWPELTADCYNLPIRYGHVSYRRPLLVRATLPWRWEGVLHEYLTGPDGIRHANLEAPTLVIGGKNKDRAHYARDADLLQRALQQPLSEHLKQRYTFYLAQSWRDAGLPEAALEAYQARAALGGWPEEVYVSLLEAARCRMRTANPDENLVISGFLRAWQTRPERAEALGELATWCRGRGMNHLGYIFASQAADIPLPADALFVEPDWYRWRARDEQAVNAYWTGRYAQSRRLCEGLLIDRHLPEAQHARVRANLHHAIDKGG